MSAFKPLQPGQSPSTVNQPHRPRRIPSQAARTGSLTSGAPRLRLTNNQPPATQRTAPATTPLEGTADPRWVLAVRTAELLQGDILSPERRERLIRMARLFDLTAFDANMIIAIVQDQARRGIAPHLCPAAGEAQLRMVTPPRRTTLLQAIRRRFGVEVVVIIGVLLLIETLVIFRAF